MRELSLHILDLLQNSLEAGASNVLLIIDEDLVNDRLTIIVEDNGRGMDDSQVSRAADPFFTTRTTRHVGLGLPLLAAAAQRCGGELKLESSPGAGTKVTATFQHSHIDRAPLGDIVDTLLAFLLTQSSTKPFDLRYRHRVGDREFAFDTEEIKRELEDVPLFHPQVRDWLRNFIAEGEGGLYQAAATES